MVCGKFSEEERESNEMLNSKEKRPCLEKTNGTCHKNSNPGSGPEPGHIPIHTGMQARGKLGELTGWTFQLP